MVWYGYLRGGVDVDDPSYYCSLNWDQTRPWVGSRQR